MAKKQYTEEFKGGEDGFHGFLELSQLLQCYMETAENILDEEEKIAQEFVDDLLRLPKPRSNVCKSGYTHLIDTFTYLKKSNEVEVGWGKYYGPMVERGATQMKEAHPHMVPSWEKNADKYIKNFKERNNLI